MRLRHAGTRGFTLAEMLVVLGIMAALTAIAIPVFLSSRAHSRRSDADNAIRAALMSARESAIRRRTVVAVEFIASANPQGGDMMVIVDKSKDFTGTDRRIGAPIPLSDFVKFDIGAVSPAADLCTLENGWNGDPLDTYDDVALVFGVPAPHPDVAFLPDGTLADPEGTTDIVVYDTTERNTSGQQVRQWLRALPATGMVVEVWHVQDPSQPEGPANPRNKGWL